MDAKRKHILALKSKHARHYDAIDQVHWGCVCGVSNCEAADLVDALNEAEKESISSKADLKREIERNQKSERELAADLAGAELRIKRLKRGTR